MLWLQRIFVARSERAPRFAFDYAGLRRPVRWRYFDELSEVCVYGRQISG